MPGLLSMGMQHRLTATVSAQAQVSQNVPLGKPPRTKKQKTACPLCLSCAYGSPHALAARKSREGLSHSRCQIRHPDTPCMQGRRQRNCLTSHSRAQLV